VTANHLWLDPYAGFGGKGEGSGDASSARLRRTGDAIRDFLGLNGRPSRHDWASAERQKMSRALNLIRTASHTMTWAQNVVLVKQGRFEEACHGK